MRKRHWEMASYQQLGLSDPVAWLTATNGYQVQLAAHQTRALGSFADGVGIQFEHDQWPCDGDTPCGCGTLLDCNMSSAYDVYHRFVNGVS